MVSGDEVRAVPRPELRQRLGGRAEFGHRPVDQVTDDGDQVRPGPVDGVDDPPGVRAAEDRPEVDVADDGDPVAVRGGRELRQRHGDLLESGAAQHAVRAVADDGDRRTGRADRHRTGDEQPPLGRTHGGGGRRALRGRGGRLVPLGGARRGLGRGLGQVGRRTRASRLHRVHRPGGARRGPEPSGAPCEAVEERAHGLAHQQTERQVDQHRQPQVAGPGQPAFGGERQHPTAHQGADGEQRQEDGEYRADPPPEAPRSADVAHQPPPEIQVQEAEQGQHGEQGEHHEHDHAATRPGAVPLIFIPPVCGPTDRPPYPPPTAPRPPRPSDGAPDLSFPGHLGTYADQARCVR